MNRDLSSSTGDRSYSVARYPVEEFDQIKVKQKVGDQWLNYEYTYFTLQTIMDTLYNCKFSGFYKPPFMVDPNAPEEFK